MRKKKKSRESERGERLTREVDASKRNEIEIGSPARFEAARLAFLPVELLLLLPE